jgi:hypothetical protein
LNIEASFASEYRARNFGRGILLGKRTLIYNEFPRIAWERDKFPIHQTEVREGRIQKMQPVCGRTPSSFTYRLL